MSGIKRHIRTCFDHASYSLGFLGMRERVMQRGLTILMYHRVLPAARCSVYPLDSLVVPDDVFASQMKWLAASCRVLPVRDALRELGQDANDKKPLVSVTFDDGYHDNAEIAAPILDGLGLGGTFFVTTGFVKGGEPLWFDRAADGWQRLSPADRQWAIDELLRSVDQSSHESQPHGIKQWMQALKCAPLAERSRMIEHVASKADGSFDANGYRPMSSQQVASLHQRGHEIACHTVNHPLLPQVDDDSLRHELMDSAQWITECTGQRPVGFCYPNGDVDSRVEAAVGDAGYAYACTTHTGINEPGDNPLRLTRIAITMQRTVRNGQHDALGFRAELCRLRELWRPSSLRTDQ